jgi:hypothetical protein
MITYDYPSVHPSICPWLSMSMIIYLWLSIIYLWLSIHDYLSMMIHLWLSIYDYLSNLWVSIESMIIYHLSIYLSIYLSIHPSIHLMVLSIIYPSICPSMHCYCLFIISARSFCACATRGWGSITSAASSTRSSQGLRWSSKAKNPQKIDQNSGKIDADWEIHPEKSWAMQDSPTISPIRVLGLAHGFGMSARCSHLKGCKNEENTYRKSRFYISLSNYSWFRLVHENFASAKSGRAIRCHQGPELPG